MTKWSFFLSFLFLVNQGITQVSPPSFVQKVYDDLYNNLSATKQIQKPKLRYFPEDKKMVVEYFSSSDGYDSELHIGVEFINVIRSFGADSSNALAFVLGHEMAHIFLEQTNIYRVGGYVDNQLTKKNNYLAKDTIYTAILESQADEQAIFYAHIGGYNVLNIAPDVLTRIYTHFKLNHKLRGYPSLEERLKIASHSVLKMSALLERFEIANLSFVAGKYQISERIYTSILNEGFKSSEIYNNLGISLIMQVVESDTIFQRYEWPIFIDSQTKLTNTLQRSLDINVLDCLNRSIFNFENASRFNDYINSKMNLCIANMLLYISSKCDRLFNLTRAESILFELRSYNLPHYQTLTAIFNHLKGDYLLAKDLLLKNIDKDPIAKRNLDKLFSNEDQNLNQFNPLSNIHFSSNEVIAMLDSDFEIDKSTKILNSFLNTKLIRKNEGNSQLTGFINESLKEKLIILNYQDNIDGVTELQLISLSDKIYYSNQYHYYSYQNWVIRFDKKGYKEYYYVIKTAI